MSRKSLYMEFNIYTENVGKQYKDKKKDKDKEKNKRRERPIQGQRTKERAKKRTKGKEGCTIQAGIKVITRCSDFFCTS